MYLSMDLFSGAGGLSLGLKASGFKTVFASDFDKQISETYKKNFNNVNFLCDDIRKIDFNIIKEKLNLKKNMIDLIVGGPPCQGFSMANRKRIEDDSRNLLFRNFTDAVKIIKPKCFLIENVTGIKSEDIEIDNRRQSTTEAITQYFLKMNYSIRFTSFKSEEFGIPQFRRRVLIVGTNLENKRKLLDRNEIGDLELKYKNYESMKNKNDNQFELFSEKKKSPFTVWDAISDLPQIEAGEGKNEMSYGTEIKNDYQKKMRKRSKKVYNHLSTPHDKMAIKRIKLINQGQNFRDLPSKLKTKSVHSGAWGRLSADGLSPTITTRFDTPSCGRVIHPFSHRTITVREAARLQSFPDTFIFYGTRTSQGQQVGNSVPPLVAEKIGEMFIKQFLG